MVEQGAVIRSFLEDLENSIMQHSLWRDASEEEMDGVSEGLEKYIMTKLHDKYDIYMLSISLHLFLNTWMQFWYPNIYISIYSIVSTFTMHCQDENDVFLTKRMTQFQWIEPEHIDIRPHHRNEASISLACNGEYHIEVTYPQTSIFLHRSIFSC